MPVQYQHFDDVPLPVANPQQDHSPAAAQSGLLDSIGGMFDVYGASQAPAQVQRHTLTGLVYGETEYLVDETGDYVVDETGDYIIGGNPAQMLRSQLSALRDKVRKRGTLWRARLDDGVREWKTARFVRMSQPQIVQDRVFKATVTCEFETAMAHWHAATASTFSGSASTGSPLGLYVENPGATVSDAVVTVTRTSGAIDFIRCRCTQLGIHWTWVVISDTLGAGDVLVVDAGNGDVAANATDSFSHFNLLGTTPGFMTIEPGNWVFEFEVEGGAADIELSFYVQHE